MPVLVDRITDWLDGEEGASRALDLELPENLDPKHVFNEYRALRKVLFRQFAERKDVDLGEVLLLNDAIDRAFGDAPIGCDEKRCRKLRDAEEFWRLALAAGAVGAWDWDLVTNKVQFSEQARAQIGVGADFESTTFERFFDLVHPDDRERLAAAVKSAQAPGSDGEYAIECRMMPGDGSGVRHINAHGRVVRDRGGRPARMMGTSVDMTARKHQEEAIERFIGILGHDLRNPLNAVKMGSRQLLRSRELSELQRATAERVHRAAERMERMISAVLDFTRSRLGDGIPVARALVDMAELTRSVVAELELAHPGRKIGLDCRGNLWGHWDPDRVAQAISNLMGNAIEHGSGPIKVTAAADGESISIAVHNNGKPIASERLARLFEPFQRGEDSPMGLGLGLFIVSEIARAHGGSVSVRSTAGDGTTFVIRLPRS
jgi:signal transduction histidine kinase